MYLPQKRSYFRFLFSATLVFLVFFCNAIFAQLPTAVAPKNNAYLAKPSVFLEWDKIPAATHYEISVSTDSLFTTLEYSNSSLVVNAQNINLTFGTYFWRIRYYSSGLPSAWSQLYKFTLFVPTQLSSNKLWLAADSGVVLDNSNGVSSWNDLSGNSNILSQVNSGERPQLQLGLNNKPAVRFDGVDDQLLGNNSIQVGTIFTLFNWAGASPLPDYNGVLTGIGGSNEVFFIGTQGSTSLYSAGYFGSQVFINQLQTLDMAPLNRYKIMVGTQPSAVSVFNGLRLASDRNFGGRFWNGNFLETLVFDAVLTPTEYNQVYNYLSYKYAPPVNLGANKIVCSFPLTLRAKQDYFTTYTWQDASSADSLVVSAPGTYYLTTTDIFNKVSVDTILIQQDNSPYTVSLGADTAVCVGQQILIQAGPSHLTYLWSTGATTNSILVDTTDNYSVTVTDCLGNNSTDAIQINVASLPVFSLGKDTLVCYNQDFKLRSNLNLNPPGFYSFLWSDNSTDSILIPPASGVYTLTVSNPTACTFTDSVTVVIDSLLFYASLGNDTAFCSGNFIQLQQGQNDVLSYLWNDNSIASSLQVTQPSGIYTYSVQVTDINGCKNSDTIQVTISGVAPNIAFSFDTLVCFGSAAQFTDLSVPPLGASIVSWFWDFGDADTSSLQNPIHTYTAAGNYTVQLKVVSSNGCLATLNKVISIHPIPLADFTNTSATALSPVLFTNTSQLFGSPVASWNWNFDDPGSGTLNTSTLQNPSHVFTAATSFSVQLIVQSSYGCSDTLIKPVAVAASAPTTLVYPKNNQVLPKKNNIDFEWDAVPSAQYYELLISNDSLFTGGVFGNGNVTSTHYLVNLVTPGIYFWKVRYFIGTSPSSWSVIFKFTQEDLANLVGMQCWLRADTGVIHDLQNRVTLWTDMSGQNHHAKQNSTTLKPVKNTGINNLPTITFDGTDDEINVLYTFGVSQIYTVFNWTGANPLPDYNGLITGKDGSNEVFFIGTQGATNLFPGGHFADQTFVNGIQTFDMAPLEQYKILNGNSPTGATINNQLIIGRDRNTPDRFWNGNISEIIVFDANQSPQGSNRVYNYLSHKYAPPVNLGANKTVCSFPLVIKAKKEYFKNYVWQDASTGDSLVINAPGMYALTTTDIFNKVSSDTLVIYQDTLPYTVNLISDTVLCDKDTLLLTAGPSHLNYTWSTGITSNSIKVTTAGTYKVTVNDCKGNTTIDSVQIAVNALPLFELGLDTTVCYNQFFKLSTQLVNPQPNYYSFLWSTGSTDSILIPTHSDTITLTVSDPIGCIHKDTIVVHLDSLLYPATLGNDTTFCSGNFIQLQQGAAVVSSYLWSDNSTASNLQVLQPIGNNYQYWVELKDASGCKKRDTINVSIAGIAPTIAFNFSSPVCFGSTTQFTDFSTPPSGDSIVSWLWNFGDTDTSNLKNPNHQYLSPGTYTVQLRISSGGGCGAVLSKTVTIHSIPIANFTNPSSCTLNETPFTNTSNTFGDTVQSYSWNFGDLASGINNSSTLKNPKHSFTATTAFNVSLITTTIYGCADTVSKTIITKPSPHAAFGDSIFCAGYPINLVDHSTYPFPQYALTRNWNFNDGSPVYYSSGTNQYYTISHLYAGAGIYAATLNILASNGCRDSIRKTIYVVSKPKADFNYSKNCVNGFTEFLDASSQDSSFSMDSIISWKWKFDNTFSSTLQNPQFKFTTQGAHQVQLTVTTKRGCSAFILKTILVKALPIASFTQSAVAGDPPITVVFTNTSSVDVSSFSWNFGDNSFSSLENPSHLYTDTGNFAITLTVTDFAGCTSSSFQNLLVKNTTIDIAVLAVSVTTDADDYVHVKADLQNKSTRIITSFDLFNRINGQSGTKETFTGNLPINGFMTYSFSGYSKIEDATNNSYVCVEAKNPNGLMDYYPNDNEFCVSFKSNEFTVSNPYPNPALNEVVVPFILPEDGTVAFKLYDDKGALVMNSDKQFFAKGLNQLLLHMEQYRSGMYAIQFTYKEKSLAKHFIKLSPKE